MNAQALIDALRRRIDALKTSKDIFDGPGDVLEVLRIDNEIKETQALIDKLEK